MRLTRAQMLWLCAVLAAGLGAWALLLWLSLEYIWPLACRVVGALA